MSQRIAVDAGVFGCLALALLFVVLLDRLLSTETPAPQPSPPPQQIVTTQPSRARALRIAVSESHRDDVGPWDDMPKLLTTLGEGYHHTVLAKAALRDPKRYETFDVLFLTCAPGGQELAEDLRRFVSRGGTLYASDWRYECIAAAFPDVVAENLRGDGKHQEVEARVVDPGLRDTLGPTVPLRFDLDQWKPAAFRGDRVTVLVEGTYERQDGGRRSVAPLLVKFKFGEGTVIFTSFHNEKQNSAVEQKLLKYLVFSAVTAQIESEVNQTLVKGGFAPQKHNLLSASKGNPEVSYRYRSTKAGKVRFVLGFDERGAKLQLTVTTPEGQKLEKQGTSTFTIEAPSRGPGDWQYTITALEVPFADFPFTVTVAESE